MQPSHRIEPELCFDGFSIVSPDGSVAQCVDIGANLTKLRRPDVLSQLKRAADAGVCAVMITGTSVAVSRQACSLCEWVRELDNSGLPKVYFTAGVHPHDAAKAPQGFAQELAELCQHPLCVAIGEAGLDYDRMLSPR